MHAIHSTHARIWGHQEGSGIHEGPALEGPALEHSDLEGFRVEATDGHVGRIIYIGREETLGGYFVVATGVPLFGEHVAFGRHVVLPVGVASLIDVGRRTVHVDRSKAEIKAAPEFEYLHQPPETDYLGHLGQYYSRFYAGGKV